MNFFYKLCALALVAAVAIPAISVSGQLRPSANCLGCLCQASTGCNATIGCSSHAGYFCGPFLISWNFWKDAGQPVFDPTDDPNQKGVFEKCTTDIYCAADTVVLYMQKHAQDCTGDGQVTCLDYAMIHKFGANGCSQPIPAGNKFFVDFQVCAAAVNE